jgi:NarL family two-component system response regulator YdfI
VDGQSRAEIVDELDIDDRTVKGHLQDTFNRVGVDSRTQAAVVGLQRGLVE